MAAVESPKPTIDSDWDHLWEIWTNLELPPGSRAEILRGAVIVSPTPTPGHNFVFSILIEQLVPITQPRRWAVTNTESIKLPATDEVVVPDLIIVPKDKLHSNDEWMISSEHAHLVVEITSPSTRERDLTWKRDSFAKANIPLYLIVDRFDGDGTTTLHHEPDGHGRYLERKTVRFGDSLEMPEPFGKIDTAEFKFDA